MTVYVDDIRAGGTEIEVSRVEMEVADADVLAVQLHNAVKRAMVVRRMVAGND